MPTDKDRCFRKLTCLKESCEGCRSFVPDIRTDWLIEESLKIRRMAHGDPDMLKAANCLEEAFHKRYRYDLKKEQEA